MAVSVLFLYGVVCFSRYSDILRILAKTWSKNILDGYLEKKFTGRPHSKKKCIHTPELLIWLLFSGLLMLYFMIHMKFKTIEIGQIGFHLRRIWDPGFP